MHSLSEDSVNCGCQFQVNVMIVTQLQVPVVKSNINSEFPIFFPPNQIEDQQYKENFSERGAPITSLPMRHRTNPVLQREIPITSDELRTQFSSTISSKFCSIWRKEVQEIQVPPGLQVELTVFK